MGRLYANENFPYPVVEELRRLGQDVLTIKETGDVDLSELVGKGVFSLWHDREFFQQITAIRAAQWQREKAS
ncbi:MAG: hypothetical protein HY879_03125 [Deltaproteobacteria bacterium]|nr:hypothetical protein [Deltaproteobacteria bacterium]